MIAQEKKKRVLPAPTHLQFAILCQLDQTRFTSASKLREVLADFQDGPARGAAFYQAMRRLIQAGWIDQTHVHCSEMPELFRTFYRATAVGVNVRSATTDFYREMAAYGPPDRSESP